MHNLHRIKVVPNELDQYSCLSSMSACQRGEKIYIDGDGEQTRDFVNVRDVVQANIKASQAIGVSGAFNLGSGERITINTLVELMKAASGTDPIVQYGPPRPGDVRHSLADISAAQKAFGFEPEVSLKEGLKEYIDWVKEEVQRG